MISRNVSFPFERYKAITVFRFKQTTENPEILQIFKKSCIAESIFWMLLKICFIRNPFFSISRKVTNDYLITNFLSHENFSETWKIANLPTLSSYSIVRRLIIYFVIITVSGWKVSKFGFFFLARINTNQKKLFF